MRERAGGAVDPRLDRLLDLLPVGILHAVDERIAYVNDTLAGLLGEDADGLIGRSIFEFLQPDDLASVADRYQRRQSGSGAPVSYEVALARRDGVAVRVELEPRAVGPRESVVLVRDVAPVARDIDLATRLSELSLQLQRCESVDDVLAEAERGLAEMGLKSAVLQLDGDELVARVVPPFGPADEQIEAFLGRPVRGLRLARSAFQVVPDLLDTRRSSFFIDDLAPPLTRILSTLRGNESPLAAEAIAYGWGIRKGVVAPLFAAREPWGAFFVGAENLSPRDGATIGLFAAQLSAALESARSIEELRRTNANLQAINEVARAGSEHELSKVLPILLETAAAATRSDRSVIYLFDEHRHELVLGGSHGMSCGFAERYARMPLAEGPLALATKTLQPVRVDAETIDALGAGDETPIREAVLLPLHVRGRLAGVLCLGRSEQQVYADREIRAAEPLAAQLAIQVENARLYSETRRRLDMLSVLFGLGRELSETLEMAPLADRALDLLVDALHADHGWIYAMEEDALELIGARVPEGAVSTQSIGLDERTVCGTCAARREPVVFDLSANRGFPDSVAQRIGARHIAAVPLLAKDRLVGTLSIARQSGEAFHEEELRLLEGCASQLGVAVERARLFEEERSRAEDLSLINELGSMVAQHLELPALFSAGVNHLSRLVPVPHIFVTLVEPDGGPMRVVASNLREPGLLDVRIPRNEPSAAMAAIHEMRPVIISDPAHDPRASRGLAARFGHRGQLAVPLISRGQPIGAVVLGETREGRRFRPGEVERTLAMANQLAGAIANARLFEEERHRVRELSLLSEIGRIASGTLQREVLLSECLGHMRSALGFETGGAWLTGGDDKRLELAARQGLLPDEPSTRVGEAMALRLAESAVATGGPVCGSQESGGSSVYACAVPLPAGVEIGGVLSLVRRHRPVTEAELRTLAAAAPEVGVALQNARLYAEARRRVEELRLLLDVGRAITGSLDLDQILEASAATLTRLVDASNSFILLLDPAARELRGAACSNPAWRDSFRATRIHLDEVSIAARCVRSRAPLGVSDVDGSEWAGAQRVRLYAEKSVLALPLLVRDEPIGCIIIDDVRRARPWTPSEIERGMLITHQVAVAVANARLYDDLKRSYGELARTQEELVKRERLAALGELAAVVAHEVRNPLGVIFNSLGSIRKILKPTGDGAMLLDIVEEEADRLDRIVRDLLEFARPNDPALQPEPLPDVIEDTLAAAKGDRVPAGVEVELEIPDDLPLVRIDTRMIRQALLNLVLNGMQSMPKGGVLKIRAEEEQRLGRRCVRLDVVDAGSGVPPELAARIFQPFFTTKASGTGLGLAVVKRILEAHRGDVTFVSRQGEGTTFTLRLPVDEAS